MRKTNIVYEEEIFYIEERLFSKEWLYEEYIIKERKALELSKEMGVDKNLFFQICKFYGISKQEDLKIRRTEDGFVIKKKETSFQSLQEYYRTHTVEETREYFKISARQWDTIVSWKVLSKTWEEKIKLREETMLQKYGTPYSLRVPNMKEKKDETCLQHWGDKNPTASKIWQDKQKEKKGVAFAHLAHINNREIWEDDILFTKHLQEKKWTSIELGHFFNVDPTTVRERVHNLGLDDAVKWRGGQSQYEDEIYEVLLNEFHLEKTDIKRHARSAIFSDKNDHRELDFYLPKLKLGIEFNGDYWHSDAVEKYQDHKGRSRHHQKKSLDAEKMGIFVFHIFEHEWVNPVVKENIKNRLKSLLFLDTTNKIPARKCALKVVSKDEKKLFFNENHIQGNDRSSLVLGLYYNEELVSCMSFVKPKTKYTWELSRFCSKHFTVVQGGASKLFSFFLKNYAQKGDIIVSYNDITKTKGTLYQTLGFQLKSINPPNYIWMNFKTKDIRTRYQEQKGGEVERMHSQGYHRICDCGTKTWVYNA